MWKRDTYYFVKPYLPRALRIVIRRWRAQRRKRKFSSTWPISPSSAQAPEGWPGWPDGKKFAVVLTHDVERNEGLQRCRQLMELESKLGFRSSFNFVPEGDYTTPKALRDSLTASGFEVGVHDLKHDGKLFLTRSLFRNNAERINRYVADWNVVGFRAGFMHHRLDWLHQLNVLYDSSTFDTDPFEPQPDGVDTIFPFWVPRPGNGYVELPYTLTQDFTMFVLLGEKTTAIWEKKIEWIAQHGGMVLVNTHPDYMNFQGSDNPVGEYPAALYETFLKQLKSKYEGQYWHALPKEVAEFTARNKDILRLRPTSLNATSIDTMGSKKKIWIDLDNTPHIPFFKPIIRELEQRGFRVVLTARDAYQVCELADASGLRYLKVGRHFGKNKLHKVWGFLLRALQLAAFALREKPVLAISHGSRSQALACNLLRIPSIVIIDYEHGKGIPSAHPTWLIVPTAFPDIVRHIRPERIRRYAGIKEDVYAPEFKPDPSIFGQLGLKETDLIVTVRPPADEAHYHNPEGETLLEDFMKRICDTEGVKAIVLPRNKRQETHIRTAYPHWFKDSKVIIPTTVVDGLNLLWSSDLVVSGGGTMNREAAALGVPVYSIFRGKTAAVDVRLQEEGRLVLIENTDQVKHKILLKRRPKGVAVNSTPRQALPQIMGHIEEILKIHYP
jgi:predicted glycosyltransferase